MRMFLLTFVFVASISSNVFASSLMQAWKGEAYFEGWKYNYIHSFSKDGEKLSYNRKDMNFIETAFGDYTIDFELRGNEVWWKNQKVGWLTEKTFNAWYSVNVEDIDIPYEVTIEANLDDEGFVFVRELHIEDKGGDEEYRWIIEGVFRPHHVQFGTDPSPGSNIPHFNKWQNLSGRYVNRKFNQSKWKSSVGPYEKDQMKWFLQDNGEALTPWVFDVLYHVSSASSASYRFFIFKEVGVTTVTETGFIYNFDGPLRVSICYYAPVEIHSRVQVEFLNSDRSVFTIKAESSSSAPCFKSEIKVEDVFTKVAF